jgi:hypothetical protein
MIQVRERGGRKTPLQEPVAEASTAENMRVDAHEVALDATDTGSTAMATPRQQLQCGQSSGHSSLHGSPSR